MNKKTAGENLIDYLIKARTDERHDSMIRYIARAYDIEEGIRARTNTEPHEAPLLLATAYHHNGTTMTFNTLNDLMTFASKEYVTLETDWVDGKSVLKLSIKINPAGTLPFIVQVVDI